MAKKKDVNIDELDDESGKSGKLVSILVAMLIIVIWLVIFALLIKMDVGGVGSMLRPFLKNVPVINRILPDKSDEEVMEETGYKYKNLAEAVDRIKELEDQLAQYQNNGAADSDSQKIQDWATTYAAMDAADAAAIMQEMTGDTDIVSKILLCMKAKQRAAILAEMDPVYAGKLTKIMFP